MFPSFSHIYQERGFAYFAIAYHYNLDQHHDSERLLPTFLTEISRQTSSISTSLVATAIADIITP